MDFARKSHYDPGQRRSSALQTPGFVAIRYEPVFEYACHEGNCALYNTLSGARAEERAAAEAAAGR